MLTAEPQIGDRFNKKTVMTGSLNSMEITAPHSL